MVVVVVMLLNRYRRMKADMVVQILRRSKRSDHLVAPPIVWNQNPWPFEAPTSLYFFTGIICVKTVPKLIFADIFCIFCNTNYPVL